MRPLTVEEIEAVAQSFKEDLQRKTNRFVRRHDTAMALATLEAIEYINQFVWDLKLQAGSQLHRAAWPARARPIRIFKKS